MNFVNYSNFNAPQTNKISKAALIEALLKYETRDSRKVEKMVEGLEEEVDFATATSLFSDKLKALSAIRLAEDKKPSPDPYMTGLDDETEEDKEEQMKKQTEMDDDDPEAYKEMPGDKEAREKGKVKTSKHTKAYDELYGDKEENEAKITISKEDMEKLHKDGKVEIDGNEVEFVDEAKFVKEFDKAVLDAKTKEEVLAIYPKTEFYIGKSDHFFGELQDNLFFKAYYTKGQEEFEIKSVYSEKGSNYVHLYNESVVVENYEVIYSDGVSALKKFRTEQQALDFMHKEIKSNKKLRNIAVYKPGMHSTTQTELVVKFWGDGSYLDNVSKKDPKLAAKKVEEKFELNWDSLIEKINNIDVNEGAIETLADDISGEVYMATTNGPVSVEATTTTKTWDDGVPVLKYLARGKASSIKVDMKKFKVVHDVPNDWFYFTDGRRWFGLHGDDGYMDPSDLPFDMEIIESATNEAKFDKKKLLKLIKNQDDAEILVNGNWYIIYNPDNGNDENTEMWAEDDVIYALDPDGEEHAIKYKDIEHFKESVEVNEADANDPVLVAFRAAKMKREKEMAKPKRKPLYGKQREKAEDELWRISQYLKDLYAERGQLLIDMEQEAEPEGGPIADRYGEKLDRAEEEIQRLIAKRNTLEIRLAESFEITEDLDEARSIGKIQKEWAKVIAMMKDTVADWKKAEGQEKSDLLDQLKVLTASKKKLEVELDKAVGLQDADAELVGEAKVDLWSEIEAEFTGIYSKLNDLAEETTDSKWRKALQGIISGLDAVESKIGQASNKLGVVPTYESVSEAANSEIEKKVQKFVIKNANDYDYSNQESAFQIYLALKKLYPRLIKESVSEADFGKPSNGDYSNEMSFGQLERCIDYSTMIRERIEAGTSLDPWMHSQITVAENELNSVFDALDGDDGVVEVTEGKTFYTTKEIIKIAKNAGDWVIDAKYSIEDLAVAYGDKVPYKELKRVLDNYDLELEELMESVVTEASDQERLTHLRKFGIAPNNQPQNGAYIKQVSKPGKFFVDWKDAFDLGDVALEFVKSVGSISVFDIIDLKTMKRTGKQLDVKKGQLGNLRTTYGVRVKESVVK